MTENAVLSAFCAIALLGLAIWFALSCGRVIVGVTAFALVSAFVTSAAVGAGAPQVGGAVEGVAAATALGAVLSLATSRATPTQFAIATLLLWIGASRLFSPDSVRGGPMLSYVFVLAIVTLAAAAYGWSRCGIAAAALAQDERAAQEVGIDPLRTRHVAITLAALVAGLAGVLLPSELPSLSFGLEPNIAALAAVVIGGVRTPIGPLVGALLLTWLTREPALHPYAHAIAPALLLVATIALPGGIASVFASALSWISRR